MVSTINLISVGFAIAAFIFFIVFRWYQGKKIELNDVVTVVIAGCMLPVAIALSVHVFFPSLIQSIESMNLQITLTGLVLIFVYGKTIIEKAWSDSS
ncbi:MAG: hypothetical protein AAFZ15_24965 [Bacteroidota bacterium]